jgi:spermidine/putrescine transport system permease protein
MVFTPALGYFFIVDILGGGKLMILGNLIKNQFLTARNWPFGAAISVFLIVITYILISLYKKIGGKMDDLGGM